MRQCIGRIGLHNNNDSDDRQARWREKIKRHAADPGKLACKPLHVCKMLTVSAVPEQVQAQYGVVLSV